MQNSVKKHRLFPGTVGARLGVLLITFVVMLFVVTVLTGFVAYILSPQSRATILLSSTMQNLLMFILPAWLTARLTSDNSVRYLGLETGGSWRPYIAAMAFLAVATPMMNAIIEWNENLSFPASFSDIEAIMRQMEEQASELTRILLADSSWWGLLSGVLIIGVLTGIAEEAFFRAGLQRALCSSRMNPHLAIWLTAFIFSAIHFQFFGFVPRLLLGAAFGYMYWTSGSLWVSATAHAFNNSIVVVFEGLDARGLSTVDAESIGLTGSYSWIYVASSALLTLLLIANWPRLFKINYKVKEGNLIYGKEQ